MSRLAALDCMCVCVFADCREATKDGLRHLGSLNYLIGLRLYGLPDVMLTDAFLESLHVHTQLTTLHIGGWRRQIKGNITAEAVKRSVRLHSHRQLLYISTLSRLHRHTATMAHTDASADTTDTSTDAPTDTDPDT